MGKLPVKPVEFPVPAESRPGPRLTHVHVGAVALFNVREDDDLWGFGDGSVPDVRGALVKVQPPVGVEDAQVESVAATLSELGAFAVRVMPRARAEVHAPAPAAVPAAHKSVRQVVEAMVEEARTSDRGALRDEVEAAMAGAGL